MTADVADTGLTGYEPAPGYQLYEQITIGGAMSSREVAEEVAAIVRADQFYRPAHQIIFAAIERLLAKHGTPVEPATLMDELNRTADLVKVGAGPYLHTCMAAVPSQWNAPYYARRVRDDWRRRNLWSAGHRVAQLACGDDFDPEVGFDQARSWVDDAALENADSPVADLEELTRLALESLDPASPHQPGLQTGFRDLDHLLNGLLPGQLVIIAARPAIGKSIIGLNIAAHVAIGQRKPVHFHSLEMSQQELTLRLMSAEARVPMENLKQRNLSDRHWDRLAKRLPDIVAAPLLLDDNAKTGLSYIASQLRTAQRKDPAALVVVDYLQLLQSGRRFENRQQEVSEMARGLKLLGKEFQVPVIALAQLNRNPEMRADKRPMLADLRESGEIEQASDIVILLHREDAYERESPRAGEMDLIVAKHRNGPTATITVAFQGHFARAMDMAPI